MISPLFVQGLGPLVFASALPSNWNRKILPGAEVFSYKSDIGEIVIQEYLQENWCLRYLVFHFLKKTVLHWKEDASLRVRFLLQGHLLIGDKEKRAKIKAGTINTIWAPGRKTYASFSKNSEYVLFHALYAPEIVRQLLPGFPKTNVPPETKTVPIQQEWNEIIEEVLDAPYDAETLHFFFENKVREILFFLLQRPGLGIQYAGLTKEEVAKVHEVDAIIMKDIKKWLHIPVLAKKVNMTEFKLKLAFKQVIGMNMFERLRSLRLEKARQLLLETNLQIKAIYLTVGYKSPSGFEDAFRNKYGIPPLRYRKKYQPRD